MPHRFDCSSLFKSLKYRNMENTMYVTHGVLLYSHMYSLYTVLYLLAAQLGLLGSERTIRFAWMSYLHSCTSNDKMSCALPPAER